MVDLLAVLENEFNAEHCLHNIAEIWNRDRWCRFSSFAQTAEFCHGQMLKAGLSQVESLAVPADGISAAGDWVVPRAWDVRSARLAVSPGGPVLADYEETPCSLVMYSASTSPEGVKATVAVVDDPEKASAADITGKFLLTSMPPQALVSLAVQAGCPGIVSDHMPLYLAVRNSRRDVWNATRWDNTFCVPANNTGLFAFSLSPAVGQWLRNEHKQNPALELHAKVDACAYNGRCHTVSGCIPGASPHPGEILAYAHLYEPGAHDNASGAAMLLELARCLAAAIAAGRLPRPRHTLRFAMGWECAGSAAYCLAHPGRVAAGVAGLVADMVGAGEADNAVPTLWRNPLSNHSVCDVLMGDILAACHSKKGVPWRERPFGIATDNVLGDPCWQMPTVALMAEPALSYHLSIDTPDRISTKALLLNGMASGAYLLMLAGASAGWAGHMWGRAERDAGRLAQKVSGGLASEALECEMRHAAAKSLTRLCPEWVPPPIQETVFPPAPATLRRQAEMVYRRIVPGCLTLHGRPELSGLRWQPAWNTALHLPLFWTDGSRTLWQATVLAAAESGDCSGQRLARHLEENLDFFRLLQEHGYIAECVQPQ